MNKEITGNKGEWSELYVLLYLLSTGKLYSADEEIKKSDDMYFPILKIFRDEDTKKLIYNLTSEKVIDIYINNCKIKTVYSKDLKEYADYLLSSIKSGSDRAFSIQGIDKIMSEIECEKIKASSSDKTDISMLIKDVQTGFSIQSGFSIKSELGNPPTLLNASEATNFIFEITGIDDSDMDRINAIDTRTKILDRVSEIQRKGHLKFVRANNSVFADNLLLIDSSMEKILSYVLLEYYNDRASSCKDIIQNLDITNPLNFPRSNFYEYKFKKFLCSVALGMMPSVAWDGKDEANGGYIIVTSDGDVLAYHIYNRDFFESYLLNNTKLERGSTTRHKFASVYKIDDKYYVNLNLQIRFKK